MARTLSRGGFASVQEAAICNDFEQVIAWKVYRAAMEKAGLSVPVSETEARLPATEHVRIRDVAPVVRTAGNIVELAPMRWSFPAGRPGGKPVFNFRSEGRSFEKSQRCLIPASAFYEFTGTTYPKTRHRFTLAGEPFFCIAGIWRMIESEPMFTMLTTAPGPDVEPYHERQVAVLPPPDWTAWLYLSKPERELLRPLPANTLTVATERR